MNTEVDQLLENLCRIAMGDAPPQPRHDPHRGERDALGRRVAPTKQEDERDALGRRVAPTKQETERVNHPRHYNVGTIEAIDAIEDWGLGFNLGNAVKYIARADHKGNAVEDLRKAAWYIQRELENRISAEQLLKSAKG